MTNERIQDFTVRITKANKTEMIAILYDIAIEYCNSALTALEIDDKMLYRLELGRVRSTLKELMNSVNTSTELGMTLMRLYIFLKQQLTKAYMDFDRLSLNHVLGIFEKLGKAYEDLSKKDSSDPVMENVEDVYSGFVYNKNRMVENVLSRDLSRGYLA